MDKQILELLTEMNQELKNLKLEMNKELKSVKSEMDEFKSEMHNRFDKVEVKLEGIGGQIEPTNESRMDDFDFIFDKVNKLEKEIYILKKQES